MTAFQIVMMVVQIIGIIAILASFYFYWHSFKYSKTRQELRKNLLLSTMILIVGICVFAATFKLG